MSNASDLSDRDLCLGLAERLGWLGLPGPGADRWLDREREFEAPEWLLTPAGAFAVLDAMRELGYWVVIEEVGSLTDGCLVHIWRQGRNMGRGKRPVRARAIAEAAYAALGSADGN